jgi:hypothetical protein
MIRFRFIVGKLSKKATMHISSDFPYNITSLCILVRVFQDEVEKCSGYRPETKEIYVNTMELNNDHLGLRIEGANCITIDGLIAEFKLYQKKDRVREELKIKVPFQSDIILRLLKQFYVSVETEANLRDIKFRLDKIEDNHQRLGKALFNRLEQLSDDNRSKSKSVENSLH